MNDGTYVFDKIVHLYDNYADRKLLGGIGVSRGHYRDGMRTADTALDAAGFAQ